MTDMTTAPVFKVSRAGRAYPDPQSGLGRAWQDAWTVLCGARDEYQDGTEIAKGVAAREHLHVVTVTNLLTRAATAGLLEREHRPVIGSRGEPSSHLLPDREGSIMTVISELWTPPHAMLPTIAREWRAFYVAVLDKYKLTPSEYRRLYIAQMGRCWICRTAKGIHPDDPRGKGSRRLGVDHNHLTGAVRGLLCTGSLSANTCNRLIARYTPAALQRAVSYTEDPPARVLAVLEAQRLDALAEGHELSETEMDRLAVAYLWTDVS